MRQVDLLGQPTPDPPEAGVTRVYADAEGRLCVVRADGEERPLASLADLAPLSATRFGLRRRRPAPPGVKLFGGNITVKASHYGGWTSFWADWDWDGWVRPQVDAAVALGMNAVRFVAGTHGVLAGRYTRGTLLGRVRQLVEYVGSVGILAYPSGGDFGQGYDFTQQPPVPFAYTVDQLAAEIAALAEMLDGYPHVVGLDVVNESMRGAGMFRPGATKADQHAYNATLAAAVAAVTSLPLTFSNPTDQDNNTADVFSATAVQDFRTADAYTDFRDVHPYVTMALDDIGALTVDGVPVVVGETGSAESDTGNAARPARLAANGLAVSRPDVVGGFVWAMTDQSADPADQWGLYTAAFAPKQASIDALADWPTVDAPMVVRLAVTQHTAVDAQHPATRVLTGTTTTLRLGRRCRVVAELVYDQEVRLATDTYGASVHVSVNGAAATNLSPDYDAVAVIGGAAVRASVAYVARRTLPRGTHVFDIRARRFGGPTADALAYAGQTRAVLTFHPL